MSIKKCDDCATAKPSFVPYAVYEMEQAKSERTSKRLIAVIVLLILLLVGSNIGWLIYESQFEVVESTTNQEVIQEADNGENHFVGGDIIGETDDQNNNDDQKKSEENN